jgi:hypothetical protein
LLAFILALLLPWLVGILRLRIVIRGLRDLILFLVAFGHRVSPVLMERGLAANVPAYTEK